MKKLFTIVFILFISCAIAQKGYKYKGDFGETQQKELLKSADSLFYYLPNISFNVSHNHLLSYKDIPVDKSYQPGYLEEQQNHLKKHPGNAVIYNNIANYYQNKGDQTNARDYYTKALNNHKLLPKAADSASYYSFRAVLKMNLGQEGVADMERAVAINKSDSLAVVLYPLVLAGRNDFRKAKSVVIDALNDKDNKMKDFSYLMLGIIEMYSVSSSFMGMKDTDKDKFLKQDISKLIDLDAFDQYMDAKNPKLVRAKQMLGIFNGIFKYSQGLEPGGVFTPSKEDTAYMQAKEEFFKKVLKDKNANIYGAYFSLGILSYAQKKFPQALDYFGMALQAFPKGKEGFQFNTAEIYDNMAGVYYLNNQYDKTIDALTKKLSLKNLSAIIKKEAYLGIAGIFISQGNLAQAEVHAQLALEIEDSFAANSMMAYISFKRNYGLSAEKYLQKAMAQISSQDEVCKALTMVAAIQLVNGSPDGAYAVYNDNKSYLEGYECNCEVILKKYVVAVK
jgi:tetratricopeptide (TPR) repeat protein